jgi:hypothetical protein
MHAARLPVAEGAHGPGDDWPLASAMSASQKHTDLPPPVARPVAVSRPVAGQMKATWMSMVTTSRVKAMRLSAALAIALSSSVITTPP